MVLVSLRRCGTSRRRSSQTTKRNSYTARKIFYKERSSTKESIVISYQPKKYWELRANPNAKGHDTAPQFIYDYVRLRLQSVTKVLEVGPGLGRTFDLYVPGQQIKTIDLFTNYRSSIAEKAKLLDLTVEQNFLDAPGDAFPFAEEEFELGLCIQVLMHVPPETISHTLQEMFRTCKKVILVSTVKLPAERKPTHVFEHDYEALTKTAGRTLSDIEIYGNTGCFVVS